MYLQMDNKAFRDFKTEVMSYLVEIMLDLDANMVEVLAMDLDKASEDYTAVTEDLVEATVAYEVLDLVHLGDWVVGSSNM